jgi:ribosomal protein S18 acetylase RimI-like enzyme
VSIEIVEAKDSHVIDMIELWKEFMDFHRNIDAQFTRGENGHAAFRTHVLDWIQSEDALVLAALENSRVVGYSMSEIRKYPPVYDKDSYGIIESMAVASSHRRRGIGDLMLVRIFDWFASRNIDRIELSVAARNQVGYSFWRKHGFRDYRHRLYLDRK